MDVTFRYQGASVALEPRTVRGSERVGAMARLELELFASEPVALTDLLGKSCALDLIGIGARTIAGIIVEATAIATSQREPGRRYRLILASQLAALELRRRCRVFQHKSAPNIVAQVLSEGGLGDPVRELRASYPPIRYLSQYHESDAAFVRRVCEEHGLWWREEDGAPVLCDAPALAPLAEPIALAEDASLGAERARAWNVRRVRRRAAGKVTLRDYDFHNPALLIEGAAEAGVEHERAAEVYAAVDRAGDPAVAAERAHLRLSALRAAADEFEWSTSALTLCPGQRVVLEDIGAKTGVVVPAGELFVVAIDHEWRHGGQYHARVRATPAAIPYRLPRETPHPKISGVHQAIVTGPPGEEIFTDEAGCVRVHFSWDREGPRDDTSSLPVRVLMPNLEGSMLIPRIGWEVWVAFEQGDPDRPFVLGRAFNGKHPPPVSLPENKTMTCLSTSSSPGASAQSYLRYEDAAGRQGMSWNAALDMLRTISNDMKTQTLGAEKHSVKGTQTITVGADQSESVTAARVTEVPAQTITVGGKQTLKTPKAMDLKVGSETVAVGAALMEHVGSPGDALEAIATAAAGAVGGLLPGNWEKAAKFASAAWGAYKGYQEKGWDAVEEEAIKFTTGLLPGGDAFNDIVDVVDTARQAEGKETLAETRRKKLKKEGGSEEDSTVGGAGGAGGGGPAAGGSGNRVHDVAGSTCEAVGALYTVVTPATSKWSTLGTSTFLVGGAHNTTAGKVSWTTAGAAAQVTGPYTVTAGDIQRDACWLTTSIGAYSSKAGAEHVVEASGALTLNCGALTVNGTLKLECGGSEVIISGGNVMVKSPNVSFKSKIDFAKWHRS